MDNRERLESLRKTSVSEFFSEDRWHDRGLSISPVARINEMKIFVIKFIEWLGVHLRGNEEPDSELVGQWFGKIYDDLGFMDSEERLMIQDVMEAICGGAGITYN